MLPTYFNHNELPGCEFCDDELCRLSDGPFDLDECGEVYNKRQLSELIEELENDYGFGSWFID